MSVKPMPEEEKKLDRLRPLLDRIGRYLDRPGLMLLDSARRSNLAERAEALAEEIRAADDRLCLGLVGGTGVGKSTLINALAGAEISSSSDVRPTTDRLVLYRHRDNSFSLDPDEQVSLHDAEALRRISLADFPDFDSLEPDHRRTLARNFPRLDLLLWVVDPVKYADQALFDWLALAPQARSSWVFVFNKTDDLHARYGPEAPGVLDQILSDFRAKLARHAGLDAPVVLPMSARAALAGGGDREGAGFAALMELIEQLKEKKRRLSIKKLNLAARVIRLSHDLSAEADTEKASAGLAVLREKLEEAEREIQGQVRAEAAAVTGAMRPHWRNGLAALARERAPWPLGFFIFVWDRLTGLFSRRRTAAGSTSLPAPELTALTRRLESWRGEISEAFGPGDTAPGLNFRQRLGQLPRSEAITGAASEALIEQGGRQAAGLAGRYRWRVRHHLLPLAVLGWPFLPLILNFFWPALTGQAGDAAPLVRLSLGWHDLLSLLEIVLGIYLLETVHYAFSLDRAAGRALDAFTGQWRAYVNDMISADLIGPAAETAAVMEEEIRLIEEITEEAGSS